MWSGLADEVATVVGVLCAIAKGETLILALVRTCRVAAGAGCSVVVGMSCYGMRFVVCVSDEGTASEEKKEKAGSSRDASENNVILPIFSGLLSPALIHGNNMQHMARRNRKIHMINDPVTCEIPLSSFEDPRNNMKNGQEQRLHCLA